MLMISLDIVTSSYVLNCIEIFGDICGVVNMTNCCFLLRE